MTVLKFCLWTILRYADGKGLNLVKLKIGPLNIFGCSRNVPYLICRMKTLCLDLITGYRSHNSHPDISLNIIFLPLLPSPSDPTIRPSNISSWSWNMTAGFSSVGRCSSLHGRLEDQKMRNTTNKITVASEARGYQTFMLTTNLLKSKWPLQ